MPNSNHPMCGRRCRRWGGSTCNSTRKWWASGSVVSSSTTAWTTATPISRSRRLSTCCRRRKPFASTILTMTGSISQGSFMVWYGMQCNAMHYGNPIPSIPTCTSLDLLKSLLIVSDMAIDPSTHLMSVSSVGDLTFLEPYDTTIPNYSHRRCGPPNVQIWAKFCCIQHSERNPSMQLWVRPSA